MFTVGIDYSLNSPAITIHEGNVWDPEKCKIFYFVRKQKMLFKDPTFHPSLYKEFKTSQERYENLSKWVFETLLKETHGKVTIYIEGYAFGASGKWLLQMAENVGVLKFLLYSSGYEFHDVGPTQAKKFGTGKGNADKDLVIKQFETETGYDLRKRTLETTVGLNPISDIADSYFICKYGFMKKPTGTL